MVKRQHILYVSKTMYNRVNEEIHRSGGTCVWFIRA